jgi:TonB family protein
MNTKRIMLKSGNPNLTLVIPMIFLVITLCSLDMYGQKTQAKKIDGAYQKVDVMPLFPGGDEALLKYIADSTHYPKDAKTKAIQGKVITRFMVKADGTVSKVSILKGVDPLLDNEAKRVVATLPKFSPGKLNGKDVPVWYVVPITFKLK